MILCVSGNNLIRWTSSENLIHDGGEKRFYFIARQRWHRHLTVLKFQPVLVRTYSAGRVLCILLISYFGALEHDNAHHRIETRIPAGSNIPERAISIVLIHGSDEKLVWNSDDDFVHLALKGVPKMISNQLPWVIPLWNAHMVVRYNVIPLSTRYRSARIRARKHAKVYRFCKLPSKLQRVLLQRKFRGVLCSALSAFVADTPQRCPLPYQMVDNNHR